MYYVKKRWTNAKKTNYGGHKYDSGFEGNYAAELDLKLRKGVIKSWERQVKIPLDVNGYHICNYYIDFIVHHLDGTTEYVETKGWQSEVWKMKWKIFEALYSDKPDVKLTVVQQGSFKAPKARRVKK